MQEIPRDFVMYENVKAMPHKIIILPKVKTQAVTAVPGKHSVFARQLLS